MFLKATEQRNPELINYAVKLHKEGRILPDTFVLDLDAIVENSKLISEVASKENIQLFFMTKQIGRNPLVAEYISKYAIKKAVVVDYKEALVMMKSKIPIANVGHLVQVPSAVLEKIMLYGVDFLTVFSKEKINEIISIAKKNNLKQKLLLKIIEPADQIYDGQFGGFRLSELESIVNLLNNEDSVEIAGITSFPCFLFDDKQEFVPTENLKTVMAAKKILEDLGIINLEVNMPSATCAQTIPTIKELGGTQGEPGHALTGTTPMHAVCNLPEKPAMVYISEISHSLGNRSYFYGGGYYRRGHFRNIKVVGDKDEDDIIIPLTPESIDYYIESTQKHPVGATVVASFRTQVFVTRSDVAVVEGLSSGNPRLAGIYDSLGNRIEGDRLG